MADAASGSAVTGLGHENILKPHKGITYKSDRWSYTWQSGNTQTLFSSPYPDNLPSRKYIIANKGRIQS